MFATVCGRWKQLHFGVRWVIAAGLVAGPVIGLRSTPAQAAGVISGFVYNDYNSNGVRDSAVTSLAAIDDGVAGVVVTVYDGAGTVQGTATSGVDGTYNLSANGSGPYRVEFTNLPTGYYPTRRGSGNGGSTQFVNAPATNVNLGVLLPCDYCQNAPPIAGSFLRKSATSANSALFQVKLADIYQSPRTTAVSAGLIPRTKLASTVQVGTLYGLAWHKESRALFGAAFAKTLYHTGYHNSYPLGTGGLGGIYRYNAATGTVALFMDLDSPAYFGNNGLGLFPEILMIGSTPNPKGDSTLVGKVGLGDMEFAADQQTLYVMDLFNKRLLGIPVGNPPVAPPFSAIQSYPTPTPPNCPAAGDVRPFAIGVKGAKVYVGITCTNQSVGMVSTASSLLAAYVYELDLNSRVYTVKVSIPLTYTRTTFTQDHRWLAWGTYVSSSNNSAVEPLLSDIEFDGYDMLLGFRGRNGDQLQAVFVAGGETLRACQTTPDTWQLESNGVCGGRTVKPYPATAPWSGATAATQGPGGGEWYWEDDGMRGEATQGGLAQIPGYRDLLTTQIDGLSTGTYGFLALNNDTGYTMAGRTFAATAGTNDVETVASMAGANNFGDIVPLCDPAPTQIGDRVWNDLNRDGVQDPGEPGLANVQVSLQGPTNTVTTATDANGNYVFGGLRANTAYVLTINPAGQGALTGLTVTAANQAAISGLPTSNDPILDTRDSDATLIGGLATLNYTTGLAGQTNHGLDFGFAPPAPTPTPIPTPGPTDLVISRTLNITHFTPGVPFSYGLTVVNNGPNRASNVTIVETPPAGLTVNTITPDGGGACTHTGGVIRCTWPTLAVGASVGVIINVTP